MYRTK